MVDGGVRCNEFKKQIASSTSTKKESSNAADDGKLVYSTLTPVPLGKFFNNC